MWILLLIFFATPVLPERVVIVEKYTTSEECNSEKERIWSDMREAYPNDESFAFACQFRLPDA